MAKSMMSEIESHFATQGWRPTGPFRQVLYDPETGWIATYWQHRDSEIVRMFIIEPFDSKQCTCGET
jgi:hypothetical protein